MKIYFLCGSAAQWAERLGLFASLCLLSAAAPPLAFEAAPRRIWEKLVRRGKAVAAHQAAQPQ